MKTIQMNKGNWSGDETDVKLYADERIGSIPEYDLKFKLVEKSTTVMPDVDIDETTYKIQLDEGDGSGFTDTDQWTVVEDRSNSRMFEFLASNWNAQITRESNDDARIAVAKLIFMLY